MHFNTQQPAVGREVEYQVSTLSFDDDLLDCSTSRNRIHKVHVSNIWLLF